MIVLYGASVHGGGSSAVSTDKCGTLHRYLCFSFDSSSSFFLFFLFTFLSSVPRLRHLCLQTLFFSASSVISVFGPLVSPTSHVHVPIPSSASSSFSCCSFLTHLPSFVRIYRIIPALGAPTNRAVSCPALRLVSEECRGHLRWMRMEIFINDRMQPRISFDRETTNTQVIEKVSDSPFKNVSNILFAFAFALAFFFVFV